MAKDVLNKSRLADEHEAILNRIVNGIKPEDNKQVALTKSTIIEGIFLIAVITYANVQIFGNNIWEALGLSLFSVVFGFLFARYIATQI